MSTDAKVTKELIETLQDGEDGFARVADEVADSDSPELSTELRRLSQQRASSARSWRGSLASTATTSTSPAPRPPPCIGAGSP